MDRGAWQATAQRVAKSQTQLKRLSARTRAHTHTHTHTHTLSLSSMHALNYKMSQGP